MNDQTPSHDLILDSFTLDFERLPFGPFGFKGHYFHEKWLFQVALCDAAGRWGQSCGGAAPLWSDSDVFISHTEVGANALMLLILEQALREAQGQAFRTPIDLLGQLSDEVHTVAQHITGRADLRRTFTLNSLVALDNAAWVLYAQTHGITRFEQLVPEPLRHVLQGRQAHLANVPAISYGMSSAEVRRFCEQGNPVLKIKLGSPGDEKTMVDADCAILSGIHEAVAELRTPYTEDGRIKYYLDINGRYPSGAVLRRLVTHLDRQNMRDHVVLIEEPFPEHVTSPLHAFDLTFAADESLHTVADVARRAEQGFRAITLKPAGKTMSISLQMAAEAKRHGLACFVADSGCVPILVDWNKNLAAHLDPLPGMRIGLLESNGPQFYKNWAQLVERHPHPGGSWISSIDGVFKLEESFYDDAGGIFAGVGAAASPRPT